MKQLGLRRKQPFYFLKPFLFLLRQCSNCKSTNTRIKKTRNGLDYELWLRDGKDGWFCAKCYNKLISNPKWNPINNPLNNNKNRSYHNSRRLKFKDRYVYVDKNPRNHICSNCGNIGNTDIHHIQYHENDPLKDTVELCNSCHMKESWRLKQLVKT